LAFWPGLSL